MKSGFKEHETQILKDIISNVCALGILVYVCLWHEDRIKKQGTRKPELMKTAILTRFKMQKLKVAQLLDGWSDGIIT